MRIDRRWTSAAEPWFEACPSAIRTTEIGDPGETDHFEPRQRIVAPLSWDQATLDVFCARILAGATAAAPAVEDGDLPAGLARPEPTGTAADGAPSVLDACAVAADRLARSAWSMGLLDSVDDLFAFRDELAAGLASRRIALAPASWAALVSPGGAGGGWRVDFRTGGLVPVADLDLHPAALTEERLDWVDGAAPVGPQLDRLASIAADAFRGSPHGTARRVAAIDAESVELDTALAWKRRSAVDHASRRAGREILARAMSGTEGLAEILGLDEEPDALFLPEAAHLGLRVELPDALMTAAEEGRPWEVSGGPGSLLSRRVAASGAIEAIAAAQWLTGDPEVAFSGRLARRARGSAPVARGAVNLPAFAEVGRIDPDAVRHATRLLTIALDALHGLSSSATAEAADAAWTARPLAVEPAGLATALMACGIAYDGEAGRATAAALAGLVTGAAVAASAEMAALAGSCPGFGGSGDPLVARMQAVARLASDSESLDSKAVAIPRLGRALARVWSEAAEAVSSHGLRNLSLTRGGPPDELAALLGGISSATAPHPAVVVYRPTESGEHVRALDTAVEAGLAALGLDDRAIAAVRTHVVGTGTLAGAPALDHARLGRLGLDGDEIARLEAALSSVLDLRYAFSGWVLGAATVERLTGQRDAADGEAVLHALGVTEDEIAEANRYCCGAFTLRGAPGLRKRDQRIFDCALASDRDGAAVGAEAQLEMTAAVEPFLTDGAGLVVALDRTAAAADMAELILEAWRAGLASIRLCRDGADVTTLAADLASAIAAGGAPAEAEAPIAEVAEAPETTEAAVPAREPLRAKGRRERLPDRRKGYTQKAKVGGHKVYLRTGEYDDGRLGEIFIDMHKEGAAFRSLINNFAIAVSIGLQYGVPLSEFVEAFTFTRFDPAGDVEGNDAIRRATSVIDYIFRELAVSYLGRADLANASPEDLLPDSLGRGDRQGDLPPRGPGGFTAAGLRRVTSTGYVRGNLRVVDGGLAGSAIGILPGRTSDPVALAVGSGLTILPPVPHFMPSSDWLIVEPAPSTGADEAGEDLRPICGTCGQGRLREAGGRRVCPACGEQTPIG